ncbi:MAG: signal recognition particle-docking protein FtsY [Bacteroidetes bacterium]|nr:signal recognition particle-docking protein FtsY [Bacteroidota bacterium]
MAIFNFFSKKNPDSGNEPAETRQGLEKTRTGFFEKLGRALLGKSTVDAAFLDELEEILLTSDVGVETTVEIIQRLEQRVARDKYIDKSSLPAFLAEEVAALMPDPMAPVNSDFSLAGAPKPYVILVVGVNGVGKTTTIGKLAARFAAEGKKVVLGAADTFRAAAVDQLTIWKERTGAEIVSMGMNADPASVAFETVKKGLESGADVVIIDTAGRLHNKVGLMNELAKIRRVIQKFMEQAPHEVLLVIDATTGQNAYEQAREFTQATQVNALAVTKLDGTARGGVVIGVSHTFGLPVKYIGLGEKAADLKPFHKADFLDAIFNHENQKS